MIRKIVMVIAAVTLLLSTAFTSYANNSAYSWYIKRNGALRPLIQKEQELIYKYDGYFIDKKRCDKEDDKVLYLTYDAGYENGNIEKILDVMKEEDVTSAFFILDNIILKNADLVTRMINEGHLVCNHTKSHSDLTRLSDKEIATSIVALEDIYRNATGREMAKYFRFPEGRYNEESLKCVQSLGYKTIFWSFAYADWDNKNQTSEDKAIKKILDNTHNGAVILLHPTSDTNAKILKTLIRSWRESGYRFGTLDELVS